MPSMTTLGLEVEPKLKERLQLAALRLQCTSHALHEQALLNFLARIENGEIQALGVTDEHKNIDLADRAVAGVFADLYAEVRPQSQLRAAITLAYRRPEPEYLPVLLSLAEGLQPDHIKSTAEHLVRSIRSKIVASPVEALVQSFSLSTQEGVALMCLAEALLRIPDPATRDVLIRDKIANGDWRSHVGDSKSIFVSAATWGLLITGKLVALNSEKTLSAALTRMIGKGGEPLIRKGVDLAMRVLGEQFVCGQSIEHALRHAGRLQKQGFRYSFDMLGEAAMTAADAQRYFSQYEQAIHAIGKASQGQGIYEGNGISIKLSALHPRYTRAKHATVMSELYPRLLSLVQLCRTYDIGINIDAEEADRLDISLDILERLCFEASLRGWNGVGTVIQAYQKRALSVIDFVIDLATRSDRRLMVRLVKGAYWDTEIKRAQVDGLEDFPVFTRKVHTDVSYLACARRLFAAPKQVFAQFASHNAQTVAAIYHMAGGNYYRGQYEFQCLHGMGEPLYEEVIKTASDGGLNRPCRIYAPVGTHETLLPYLVRRLLENGANTSFVNQIHDPKINPLDLVTDPVEIARGIDPLGSPNPKIPLPLDLYRSSLQSITDGVNQLRNEQFLGLGRQASRGLDLTDEATLESLAVSLISFAKVSWYGQPMLATEAPQSPSFQQDSRSVINPADRYDVVGTVIDSTKHHIDHAISEALATFDVWQAIPVSERATMLERAADIFEANQQSLIGLIVREAGKTLPTAISEVREAVDFLRYYAIQARYLLDNKQSPESIAVPNDRPLGLVLCISPWNFPLAIFTGQVAAALVVGNVVLAKPAEQSTLIACEAVRLLHEAGILPGALQCLPGSGEITGQLLVANEAIDGVMFTGSTETARAIARTLSHRLNRHRQPVTLIAETGGLNAMVVDSSALPEQVVADVIASAFDSAGQRCSALRILLLQQETADVITTMLKGAMDDLSVGNPARLSTDIGPVIDSDAMRVIVDYISQQKSLGRAIYQGPLSDDAASGNFVVPTLVEIDSLEDVQREIFGPVLHVMRYRREDLDRVIDDINAKRFGLTFGLHTRIDEVSMHCIRKIQVGNVYVNRNIIGASVGVQPFGGQGLSGTGPKAGGPLYLRSLIHTDVYTLPAWMASIGIAETTSADWPLEFQLPGPTGEDNVYQLIPRGLVLCLPQTELGILAMCKAVNRTGNIPQIPKETARQLVDAVEKLRALGIELMVTEESLSSIHTDIVLCEGEADQLLEVQRTLLGSEAKIVSLYGLTTEQIACGQLWPLHRLLHEKSICINTTAAGGNASLMTIG